MSICTDIWYIYRISFQLPNSEIISFISWRAVDDRRYNITLMDRVQPGNKWTLTSLCNPAINYWITRYKWMKLFQNSWQFEWYAISLPNSLFYSLSLSPFFPLPSIRFHFINPSTSKLTFSSVITSRTNFIYEFDTIFITIINKKKKC